MRLAARSMPLSCAMPGRHAALLGRSAAGTQNFRKSMMLRAARDPMPRGGWRAGGHGMRSSFGHSESHIRNGHFARRRLGAALRQHGVTRMSMAADDPVVPPDAPGLRPLPQLIFSSRWLQVPLYLGLIVAQGVYVVLFLKELWHLVLGAMNFTEQEIMLLVLGLIDVVMISNLLIMVIVGGYETFVSRLELELHPDQPEWLSHVNASVLKIKLAMAIIGISSIHLLRTFINAGSLGRPDVPYTEAGVMWQTIIHGLFILSAIGIAYVEKLSQSAYSRPDH
jgi:uncharacterized protein (TIGR00645 family)